ncbi:MAG: AbrB/MazE/SpoVT family DNA-binding domain-containing protein [Candidatus Thermoplasmatota archaeon]|nr:AbrB/MazE/SpoVT family DNA-binding domain-containing protein [Candidatus Thermoplasmatota archaeon]
MNTIITLDTRGRLVIPTEFREALNLQEGDDILLSLDETTRTAVISPIPGARNKLVKIDVDFDDAPGSLAKIAELIAKLHLDLVMTESKSYQRGKKARWSIIADISSCPHGLTQIKKSLLQHHTIDAVSITTIARDRLHR